MGLYDIDFHAWSAEQADAVRRRSANEIDWENVAEELESLGKQLEWELYNRYRVLLMHLLKWKFQPRGRSPSWRGTIAEQRRQIARLIRKNPSLKSKELEEFSDGYENGRLGAIDETDLPEETFPLTAPFTPEQAKDESFWPDSD